MLSGKALRDVVQDFRHKGESGAGALGRVFGRPAGFLAGMRSSTKPLRYLWSPRYARPYLILSARRTPSSAEQLAPSSDQGMSHSRPNRTGRWPNRTRTRGVQVAFTCMGDRLERGFQRFGLMDFLSEDPAVADPAKLGGGDERTSAWCGCQGHFFSGVARFFSFVSMPAWSRFVGVLVCCAVVSVEVVNNIQLAIAVLVLPFLWRGGDVVAGSGNGEVVAVVAVVAVAAVVAVVAVVAAAEGVGVRSRGRRSSMRNGSSRSTSRSRVVGVVVVGVAVGVGVGVAVASRSRS